jgi:type IV pilus assembly protein PilB
MREATPADKRLVAAEPLHTYGAAVPNEGRPLLGALLVQHGWLAPADLERALFEKERTGGQLGQVLVELGLISTRTLAVALSHQHGLEFLDLAELKVDEEAAALLPQSLAARYRALPVAFEDGALLIAVADPTNLMAHDDLRMALGTDTRIVVADATELDSAIVKAYHLPPDAVETFSGAAHDPSVQDLQVSADAAPAIKLVNELIGRALKERASDIHFAPSADHLVVRVRVDGVTHELTTIPNSLQAPVIARLKIMGGLDIAQRRVPQDGRVDVRVAGQPRDLRIAVLPTLFGEQVVLRILQGSFSGRLEMAELGMSREAEAMLRRAVARPYGAILACGPTGSGKTTTLYAALDLLNDPGRVIVTIEDPVEYQMAGVGQIEIDPLAGLTFARGLRTILRSDPDVILVGEARDEETARIAMQAATTGHLVLTTLHAHSASSAIVRLKDMGVDAGMLAPALNCIIAQRLARRLCLKCREAYSPGPEERQHFGLDGHGEDLQLYRARGCDDCLQTGYQGRVAMYEVMPVEGKIRRLIAGSSDEIFAAALEQGMTTLRESGVALCVDGVSSLEEINRVIGDAAVV